jgi:hypothetical protein
VSKVDWVFNDPPNCAVFTERVIVDGDAHIGTVSHDADDGAWQFLAFGSEARDEDARLVGLWTIVRIDPSVEMLADLPLGWYAFRALPNDPWQRVPKSGDISNP